MRGLLVLAVLVAALSGCIPNTNYGYRPGNYAPPPPEEPTWEPQRIQVPAPPSAKPAWEVRSVTADAQRVPSSTYVVQYADTLRGIAEKLRVGSENIARANNLTAPYVLRPGQRLTVPGGRYHLVKPGESGIAIAIAYHVKWADIVAINDLTEPFVLRSGRRILIPDQHVEPQTLRERAAAFKVDLGDIATGGGEPAIPDDASPARPIATRRLLPSTAAVADPGALRGPFIWPVATGNVVKRFGAGASGERNDGIKIAVPVGTPVKATAAGVVIYTSTNIPGLGGIVMVKHGDGWTSVYGHDSRILVQRGQSVKRGQTIAYSGDTGLADRPELHFELRKGRTPVDPLSKLPVR